MLRAAAASVRHEDLEQLKSLVRSRCQESHACSMSSPPPSSDAPTAELSAFVGAMQSQQTLEHATRLAVEQRAFGLMVPEGSHRASHLHAQLSCTSSLRLLSPGSTYGGALGEPEGAPGEPLTTSAATLRRIGEARAQGAAWHRQLEQAAASHAVASHAAAAGAAAAHASAVGAAAAATLTQSCRSPYASYSSSSSGPLSVHASSSMQTTVQTTVQTPFSLAALSRPSDGRSVRAPPPQPPQPPPPPPPPRPVRLPSHTGADTATAALALQHLHAEISLARADRAAAIRARTLAEEAHAAGRDAVGRDAALWGAPAARAATPRTAPHRPGSSPPSTPPSSTGAGPEAAGPATAVSAAAGTPRRRDRAAALQAKAEAARRGGQSEEDRLGTDFEEAGTDLFLAPFKGSASVRALNMTLARLTVIKKNGSLGGICPMDTKQLIIGR